MNTTLKQLTDQEYDKLKAENERLREALEEIADYKVYRFKLLPHENKLLEKVVDIAQQALKGE